MPKATVETNFLLNGQGHGSYFAESFADASMDPGLFRPFIDPGDGKHYCVINTGEMKRNKAGVLVPRHEKVLVKDLRDAGIPVVNAPTALRKDEWIAQDDKVIEVAAPRLRAWSDLAAASSMSGFDGYSSFTKEHEVVSSGGEAIVDMDGMTEGRGGNPLYQLDSTPLAITHSSFFFSRRQIAASRKKGQPLSTRQGGAASKRVAESVEKTLIGVQTGITFGTDAQHRRASRQWGYLNFPNRITSISITNPTSGGWTPQDLVDEVLEMREALADSFHYDNFMMYHSTDFDKILDNDYSYDGGNNPSQTLRQRIRAIEGINDVRRLDFLTASTNPWTIILVEMSDEVAQAVEGMSLRTLQWESHGGERLNFKVMTIMVGELYSDYNGNTGILVATT